MTALKKSSWVLLRGLGRESGHWNDFPLQMQERFPEDQIITLDLPGAGEFRQVRPPLTVSGFVEFMRKELEKKEPQYPVNLVSVSLGGMVAMEWMRKYPMSIQSGTLINTSLGNLSAFYKRLRWESYSEFFTKVALLKGEKKEKAILNVISNKKDNHEDIARKWAEIQKERPIKSYKILQQLAAASHYKIKDKVDVPTLLLVGLGDKLVNPQCTLDIHDKFGYPVVKHPWGGHDLTVDDGPWVVNEIKTWKNSL